MSERDEDRRVRSEATVDLGPASEQASEDRSHSDTDLGALPWHDAARDLESEPGDRRIRQRLLAEITGEEQSPPTIGRFEILRRLGAGAMGVVYAAYDDQLDREVALKLLHPGRSDDSDATHRLLREAQALAKLSHPNLVPVFEVGHVDEQVFLAMELVPGQTLGDWVDANEHPWQEVLQRWLEVGSALVAVHEAGLVHRDVKPDNVLVGDDGRARLVDFGLARGADGPHLSQTAPAFRSQSSGSGSRLNEVITQTRATVGTPAYMAPEVRWGSPAGPAADQYSLCVSLYESLFGQRPKLRLDEATLTIPPGAKVPASVRRLLNRGLAFDLRNRYPSTRALTEDMERILGVRRPRWVLGVSALMFAAGLGGLATWSLVEPAAVVDSPPPCADVEDDLDGVWDEPHRTKLRQGIEASALPYATSLADAVDERLDGYAETWMNGRRAACEATHVEHVQSPELLDRRMACLDQKRQWLRSVVEAGSTVDAAGVPRLPALLANLAEPGECMGDWLRVSPTSLPPPEQREAVAAINMKLSRLETEALLYGTRDTIGSVEQALADAERIGHAPLVAEATLTLGWFLQYTDNPRARPVLERAANLAEASDLPSIKERAQRQLVTVAVQIDHDYEQAAVELDRLMATLTRLGHPPVGTAGAVELRSLLAAMKGDYDRARADLRTAIGLWREIGNHRAPRQANAWRSLGDLLAAAGRHDEAQQAFEHANALTVEPTLDGDLPSLQRGRAELTLGQSAVLAGRLDEADALLAKAHAEGLEAYGEDSVFIARVAMAQSDAANRRGQLDVAAAHAKRADANIRRWMGDDPLLRVSPLSAVGTVAFYRGQFDVSIDAYAEALRLWLRSMPADSPQVAVARSNLAEALVATEQYDRAEPELRRALAALEARMDPGHPWLAFPAHGLAEIEFRRGEFEPALEHGRIALEIREASGDHPSELARIRWLMARIHLGTGARDEALRLARLAREGFIRLGEDFVTEVEAIDTWLEDN